jgi:N4-gp56 family major capsid protein
MTFGSGQGMTTYGDINQRTAVYAAVEMLRHAEPVIVLNRFAQSKPLPGNTAKTVKFRRALIYSAQTVPLQEGVTPTTQKFGYEDVQATIKQYGGLFGLTDVIQDTGEDPVLKDMMQACGEQAGRTVEAVTWGVVRAGTSVYYANGAARNQVNTPISLSKQRAVVRNLKNQKAMKLTSILDASPKFQTRAVEAAYICIAHTNCESDIRGLPGFTKTAEYGQRSVLCPEEIGCVEDVRYILSPDLDPFPDAGGAFAGSGTNMVTTTGVNADVYPMIFVGKEAYGVVPLKGRSSVTPSVINPNRPSAADPLGQRGYVGWKCYHTAVILNDSWMSRLEVAVTDLN